MLYWHQKYGTLCNTDNTLENSHYLLYWLSDAASLITPKLPEETITQDDWSMCQAVSYRDPVIRVSRCQVLDKLSTRKRKKGLRWITFDDIMMSCVSIATEVE